jgi:hypothetical protein
VVLLSMLRSVGIKATSAGGGPGMVTTSATAIEA